MTTNSEFDLTYVTIDSLSEGVGSSQITPLITRLSTSGLRISLISYEKRKPSIDLVEHFDALGVTWSPRPFGSSGPTGGLTRLHKVKLDIPKTKLIHARSDIPAVSAIASRQAPVLWDVRSLWADQKRIIQKSLLNNALYGVYRGMESVAARGCIGMSTLSSAVIPILEQRHKKLPLLRTVVSTTVDLNRFQFSSPIPIKIRALFSGTYNQYYDLHLSALFISELRKHVDFETHWARPVESDRDSLGVTETKVFPATQFEMATLIPNFSFGVSVCKMNNGPSLTAAMPTKIAEFLACGRPIVVNKGLGDMDSLIEEFKVGVVLDGTKENLSKSAIDILELLLDPELPNRCRALAESNFNMDVGAQSYLHLYAKMLKESGKNLDFD